MDIPLFRVAYLDLDTRLSGDSGTPVQGLSPMAQGPIARIAEG